MRIYQERLSEFEKAQHSDPLCCQVIKYCRTSWPGKKMTQSHHTGKSVVISRNLLLHDTRIVIPASKQQEIPQKIHSGHQGIQRCRECAKMSVWWPGHSRQIEEFVKNCPHCVKESTPRKEPLMPSTLPEYPWQRIGTDLFILSGKTHLIAVDYFLRYPEVVTLSSVTSHSVITALKSVFAQHGIPGC